MNGTVENTVYVYYTATQRRILTLLADGLAHPRKELHACLSDELTNWVTLGVHLHYLRKKLAPLGETIICELVNRRICYRHVCLVKSRSGSS